MQKDRWFSGHPAAPGAQQLWCFPYAGGSGTVFHAWKQAFSDDVELRALELPGRWTRSAEPLRRRFFPLVEEVADAMERNLSTEYSLFGYSLGGLLAFEVARTLARRGKPYPRRLFVAACAAPQVDRKRDVLHDLPDHAFLDGLSRRYAPLPEVILEDEEMLNVVLRILRADLELLHDYHFTAGDALDCPIVAFGGRADKSVSAEGLAGWRACSTHAFSSHWFDGDHFFITSHGKSLARSVYQYLSEPRQAAVIPPDPARMSNP